MTITISSEKAARAASTYFAIVPGSGDVSTGATPGEALDALLNQRNGEFVSDAAFPVFFVIRTGEGDPFFTNEQNTRLQTLWAQQKVSALSPHDAQELDDLLQAEIRASGERAAFLAH